MKSRALCDAGFSLVESLIATALTVMLLAAVFAVVDPERSTFATQLEASDLQQRLRVVVDTLSRELRTAGAGPVGPVGGGVSTYGAPIRPYRAGPNGGDAAAGVFFRSDTVTVLSSSAAPPGAPAEPALYLDRNGTIIVDTAMNGHIARVVAHTYYLRVDEASGTFQLRRLDGMGTDSPVVDHVVGLSFSYLGDPAPPVMGPDDGSASGPRPTYGPPPPPLDEDDETDTWPPGENCVFAAGESVHTSRLAMLGDPATLVELSTDSLTDGPWCPDATNPERYDADLLRIRRVRVVVRVEVAAAAMRGPAGALFLRGGSSTSSRRLVPDQEIQFDVTPRNMNGFR